MVAKTGLQMRRAWEPSCVREGCMRRKGRRRKACGRKAHAENTLLIGW
jgi:hypothetical protein